MASLESNPKKSTPLSGPPGVRQNHFFGQPKCLQGYAIICNYRFLISSGSIAETVGSSFCKGFSVSENHKCAPKKRIGCPCFVEKTSC